MTIWEGLGLLGIVGLLLIWDLGDRATQANIATNSRKQRIAELTREIGAEKDDDVIVRRVV